MSIQPRTLTRLAARVLALSLAVTVAACGGGDGGGGGGAAAGQPGAGPQNISFKGAQFTVGSKEFTEQLILGEITKQALEAAGAKVNDQIGLAGTVAARKALTSGEIDMYWEYTGTGWITHLGQTEPFNDPQKQFQKVKQMDQRKNNVVWLAPPAPANNTYAIAVRQGANFGIQTLSDLARFVKQNPQQATFCTNTEFASRDDGLPGLEKAYNFQFPEGNVSRIQTGLIYNEVSSADGRCNFGVVFATDGRVQAKNLKIIKDDKGFFANYAPALNVRQQVMQRHPKLREFFDPIAKQLTTEKLRSLNAKVDVEGQQPAEVAEQFLKNIGFMQA